MRSPEPSSVYSRAHRRCVQARQQAWALALDHAERQKAEAERVAQEKEAAAALLSQKLAAAEREKNKASGPIVSPVCPPCVMLA